MEYTNSSKVRVCVRCRPLTKRELVVEKGNSCVSYPIQNTAERTKLVIGQTKEFSFDSVFDEKCNQELLFESCIRDLVEGCFSGYNATVFAYGQTGSGKTYTMGSSYQNPDESAHSKFNPVDDGIIPRSMRYIFQLITNEKYEKSSIKVTFLEIYNEEIRDLLHSDVSSTDIAIREGADGKIFFHGARDEIVRDMSDVYSLIERGAISRTTGDTLMNESSSRSHAIFTVSFDIIQMQDIEPTNSDTLSQHDTAPNTLATHSKHTIPSRYGQRITSKLHLVDLAGSERAKRTGAIGQRFKESVGINQGLLALGKVIRALTTSSSRGGTLGHVPYRDSKLTRFLQDSLGGNSRTVMLACISPSDTSLAETLSTLQYASRARAVQNKVVANVTDTRIEATGVMDEGSSANTSLIYELRQQMIGMQAEVNRLRKEASKTDLKAHRSTSSTHVPSSGSGNAFEDSMEELSEVEGEGEERSMIPAADVESLLNVVSDVHTALETSLSAVGNIASSEFGPARTVVQTSVWVSRALGAIVESRSQFLNRPFKSIRARRKGKWVDASDFDSSTKIEELRKENEWLRHELEEAQKNLKRDEVIFSEKVQELRRFKTQYYDLEKKNETLLKQIQIIYEKQKLVMHSAPTSLSTDTSHQNGNIEIGSLRRSDTAPVVSESNHVDDQFQIFEQKIKEIEHQIHRKQKKYSKLTSGELDSKESDSKVHSDEEKNEESSRKEEIGRLHEDIIEFKKIRRKLIGKLKELRRHREEELRQSADSIQDVTIGRSEDWMKRSSYDSIEPERTLSKSLYSNTLSPNSSPSKTASMSPNKKRNSKSSQKKKIVDLMSVQDIEFRVQEIVQRRVSRDQAILLQSMINASRSRIEQLKAEIDQSPAVSDDEPQGDLLEELEVANTELELLQNRFEQELQRACFPSQSNFSYEESNLLWEEDKDFLFQEIATQCRSVPDEAENSSDSLVTTTLIHFLSSYIEIRYKNEKESGSSGLLEMKCSELENRVKNLQTALKRTKIDHSNNLDQIKREHSEKMEYLLRELRDTENKVKIAEEMNMIIRSGEVDDGQYSRPVSRSRLKPIANEISDQNVFPEVRQMAAQSESDNKVSPRINNDHQAQGNKNNSQVISLVPDYVERLQHENERLSHRWITEKQRREQLEKRNGELVREIRSLRQFKST